MNNNMIELEINGGILELSDVECAGVAGGSWVTAGEASGATLIGLGVAIAPETAGGGLVVAAVGGLIFGFCAAADVRLK